MKILLLLVTIISTLVLTACSDDKATSEGAASSAGTETALEHAQKHLDPKYVCPMHPQIIRDEPGTCPICGMDLVKKEAEQSTSSKKEKKILYWVAPMDPSYRRDEPGKSPMGMDLVPVYDEGSDLAVKISPAVENNMGIRTATVQRDKLWRRIDTVGYVDFDENRISHIHLRTKGWIEKLLVKSEGEQVSKGQLLFEVYAPELVSAQDEFIQALGSGHKGLITASRDRLLALGISAEQIKTLRKTRKVTQYIKVFARQDGIVAKLNVREGMFVMPQKEVMTLADLSSVWLLAEVFESQSDWLKVGQPAEVHLSYLPGRQWEGKVEYIYPSLDPKTRTLKVRLRFDNPDQDLKPNMFADITIFGGARKNILIIPREALIRTGEEQRVILAVGKGRFQPRKVTAGMESGDWTEIITGLKEGESVVTSGQFLIDSEASLKASLVRMSDSDSTAHVKKIEGEAIIGTGILHEISAAERTLNMSHDPIPMLDWPEMTMSFKVRDDVKLDAFKPDDKVEFELEQGSDGYVIKTIRQRQ